MRTSLTSSPLLRLSALILLVLLCLGIHGLWMKNLANEKARSIQLANARAHYTVVLSDLDRRWGREAFNLKTRIESQNLLNDLSGRKEQLQTFLISQGSSIEFPSLRIEKTTGEVIASYDYASHADPKIRFHPGQTSTWAYNPADKSLYLVIRQFIWLGKENGYLLLFKPMDHSLLTQTTYPGTRLSLWWKGEAIASTDGEDGLRSISTRFTKPVNGENSLVLMWSGPESDNVPKLLIETIAEELLSADDIAKPMLFLFLGLIALAAAFSVPVPPLTAPPETGALAPEPKPGHATENNPSAHLAGTRNDAQERPSYGNDINQP